MKNAIQVILATVALFSGNLVEAKTVRASEMSNAQWAQLYSGKAQDLVVEFREGDVLPVSLEAEGDLVATRQAGITYMDVKKNFWLKLDQDNLVMSLDGENFKPLNQLISGSLTAGAEKDPNSDVANSIKVRFNAYLKK